ncbi:MAG: hypothetical protein IH849_05430 [Acidobacteria bacterium]|nr:hypothetical protein [Acidobacteriota bacterium]
MRSVSLALRTLVTTGVLLLAPLLLGDAVAQGERITLLNQDMVYLDIVEGLMTFEWVVDVRNNTDEPLRLRIVFDLLDDDDQLINRDEQGNPQNAVIITVEPRQTVPVEQQGSLSYDLAAEIVTYRHRWEIIQAPR